MEQRLQYLSRKKKELGAPHKHSPSITSSNKRNTKYGFQNPPPNKQFFMKMTAADDRETIVEDPSAGRINTTYNQRALPSIVAVLT
jgi:hypothetical protein